MRFILLFFAMLIFSLIVSGQDFYESYQTKYFSSGEDTSAYTDLLNRFRNSDSTLQFDDFKDLYFGAIFLKSYNPEKISQAEEEIRQANFIKDFQLAYDRADRLLKKYPMSIQAYFEKSWACHNLEKPDEEEYYKKRYKILIKVVLDSGDGTSPDSAYYANLPNDEFEFLKYLKLEIREEKEISYSGNVFDVFSLKSNKAKIKEIYFNVSRQHR